MSNNTGEVWTSEEFAIALDMYLDGKSIGNIAITLGRKYKSIKDVLSDFPINRRECIQKLAQAKRESRTGRKWVRQERKYLVRLQRVNRKSKKLTHEEISIVLGRSVDDIEKEIKRVVIQRPTAQRLFSNEQMDNS